MPASSRPSVDLPAPGRADHGDPLADPDVEVDAVQHVAALDVGEPDVVGVDLLAVGCGAGDLAVVGHLGDAEQPGQRGGADLQLVEDADDPVDRVDQHLHVERRRRDLAERDLALGVEVAAEQQRRHRRDQVGELHVREEHRAQEQRVALGVVGLRDVGVDRADPLLAEAERLDGARALDGLGQRRVDLGVRRGLAQVAVLGAGEVPAQPDHQRRDAEQAGQRDPPADATGGGEGEHGGHHRDRPLGQRVAHRPAELVDVAAGAGQQVAGAGRLDDADRQRERVADEVLAQLGQHLLAEHLAEVAGVAGQHGLEQQERRPAAATIRSTTAGRAVARPTPRGRRAAAARPAPASAATACRRERAPEQPRVAARESRGVAADRPGRRRRAGRRCSSSATASRLELGLAGHDGGGTPGRGRAARRGCRSRRPGRRAGTRRRRPGRAPAGCSWSRRWCGRRGARAAATAIRASVWASTAEVGSTRTRISGSATSARASTSRCRWPPEKQRPRSATTVSRPSGSASRMSSAQAVSSARASVAASPRDVEPLAQRTGEQHGCWCRRRRPGGVPPRGAAPAAARRRA